MTVIHVHHEDLTGSIISRALAWLNVAFKTMHQAIVAAKLERLESELVVRRGYGGDRPSDRDALRYPQRPLLLSDKWDF
jgi:hypothetical protein